MTDKVELIKQELEKLKVYPKSRGFIKYMLAFIESLLEEPASKDLEEACDNYYDETWDEHGGIAMVINNCNDIWFPSQAMEDFFKAGANWQKQQMMRDVVLETKVMKDCDGDGIETPYAEWLTLENTEIPYIPDNLGLKEGDKVKIIIVKEENK